MSTPTAAILTIGNELLDGRVFDTNTNFLADFLYSLGFAVKLKSSCNDDVSDIQGTLQFLLKEASCVIVSGGLGPTEDDMTRDAIALTLGAQLEQISSELDRLEQYFLSRGYKKLPSTNTRQASFPKSAKIIPNSVGTASGFQVQVNSSSIYCLPGVPKELKVMCSEELTLRLKAEFPSLTPPLSHTFGIFGIPESRAGEILEEAKLSRDISVSYRASFPYLQIKLSHSASKDKLDKGVHQAREALGAEYIFIENAPVDLSRYTHSLLVKEKLSLATAESCTGGLLAKTLTDNAGSSEYFMGSVVAYSNEAKVNMLNVSQEALDTHGAVSHEVARELARGAQQKFRTDVALSTTGIAGPGGGTDEKPVGTVFIGLAFKDELYSFKRVFPFSRTAMRSFTNAAALDFLRRKVEELPLRESIE